MLQWFIGPFDDTADSAALVQAPVGSENVIKPMGTRANIDTKSFGWLVSILWAQLPTCQGVCLEQHGGKSTSPVVSAPESEKVTPPFL